MKNLLIEGRSGSVPPVMNKFQVNFQKDTTPKAIYGGGLVSQAPVKYQEIVKDRQEVILLSLIYLGL